MDIWYGIIKVKNILECGKIICKMDMVFIYGTILKMKINILEIDMLVNGKKGKEMDMENFIIVMEIYMKAIGKIILKKDLEYYIIMIDPNLLDILKMTISLKLKIKRRKRKQKNLKM